MKTFEEFRFSIPHNKVKLGYKYTPKTKTELVEAIESEIEEQGLEVDLDCIDTSNITDMSHLFDIAKHKYARNFNGDIGDWNVSNVEDMYGMFAYTESFNQDISNWDVSNVKCMSCMFIGTKNFNGNISNWNVNNVKYMSHMFYEAESFNQDISGWDVNNVKLMNSMFRLAKSFNQDISGWDVSNVNDMEYMFDKCPIKEEYKPKFK